MSAKKAPPAGDADPKTQKLNVWLSPDEIAWLRRDKEGPSAAVRALITEAMQLENLAKSVKSGKKSRAHK